MRKTMTPELFDKLKDVKSSSRATPCPTACRLACCRPHLGVGFTCGDEECFDDLLQGRHLPDRARAGTCSTRPRRTHTSDLDLEQASRSRRSRARASSPSTSSRRASARRATSLGFSLPAGSTKEERLAVVESVLKHGVRAACPDDLQGHVLPARGPVPPSRRTRLQAGGFLFQKPGPMQLLGAAGAGRELAGGPWHLPQPAEDGAVLVPTRRTSAASSPWRTAATSRACFTRFCQLSNAIKAAAEGDGQEADGALRTCGFLGHLPVEPRHWPAWLRA